MFSGGGHRAAGGSLPCTGGELEKGKSETERDRENDRRESVRRERETKNRARDSLYAAGRTGVNFPYWAKWGSKAMTWRRRSRSITAKLVASQYENSLSR